jgi:hypothetical protein
MIALSGLLLWGLPAWAVITFSETTTPAGVAFTGESFGASWGDVNSDGLPDIFVNHHRGRASIYVNQGDGTFEDRYWEVDIWDGDIALLDQHGGAWGDWDNDGDSDLFISLGARDASQFLVNENGVLVNRVDDYSFENIAWPGRLPMWFDFTGDGKLDFTIINRGFSRDFEQMDTPVVDFVRTPGLTQNICQDNQYGHLMDADANGTLEWVCVSTAFPDRIYDIGTLPFLDVSPLVPTTPNVTDSAIADFDGDLRDDIVMARGRVRISGAEIVTPTTAEAHLISQVNSETGIRLETNGDLTVVLHWSARNVSDVRIGAGGINPPLPAPGDPISFTLSAADTANHGIEPHDPAVDRGVYVGFDPVAGEWTFLNSSGAPTSFSYIYAFFDTTTTFTNVTELGLGAIDGSISPLLMTSAPGSFVDNTVTAGLNLPAKCSSVVAADFDNDMDQDLYFVCRNAVTNSPNRLFENDGTGVFTEVATAFGAEGVVGPAMGLGDVATTADYDVDGYIDLFVTNGLKLFPEEPFLYAGPDQLFRNSGSGNNWTHIDLVGVTSNRDAIGAVVTVTAGGVQQRQARDGGYHRWSQDSGRLHFGLAANSTFDVEVRWPDGTVETYTGNAANAVYEITEGTGIATVTVPTTVAPSVCLAVGGGNPEPDEATEHGVFMWRDCGDPLNWHVRILSGTASSIDASGNVISTQPFDSVTEVGIEANDTLDFTTDPSRIRFVNNVTVGASDGWDFTIPAGAEVCLELDLPEGEPVLLGRNRMVMTAPFELTTLGSCANVPPTVSVGTAEAFEDTLGVDVPVTLSHPFTGTVTVDYETQDDTALAGSDYVATTDTLTFLPNETSQLAPVVLIDDSDTEGNEAFQVVLTAATGAALQGTSGLATIRDDEASPCGMPTIDPATESGVFVYEDCATGLWSVRAVVGGGDDTFVGGLFTDVDFGNVTLVSIEPEDSVDATTDPQVIDFLMEVQGSGSDGFDFTAPGTELCFALTAPSAASVFVGINKIQVSQPFDLLTGSSCTNLVPELEVQAVSVAENAGSVDITVALSAPVPDPVSVDFATVDGTAEAGLDYTATSGQLSFAANEVAQTITVPILNDALVEGLETFTISLTNPVGATVSSFNGEVTISEDEVSPCNSVPFNGATEAGTYLYRDCGTGEWFLRVAQGGGPFVFYQGSITSSQPFTAASPFSLEGSDVYDVGANGDSIDFSFGVGGSGVDGIDLTVANGVGVCVDISSPSQTILLGDLANPTPVQAPFDLGTLGPCLNAMPDINIDSVQLAENDAGGVMTFTVSLSEEAGMPVTVDYTTADLAPVSAQAGVDYTATSGTLTFAPAETGKTIDVPIIDDAIGEVSETFEVVLSNAGNGVIVTGTGTGTILDDEGVSMIAITDVTIDEDDVAGTASVTLSLSQAAGGDVTVDVATVDGSAIAGEDYLAASGTVTFTAGSLSETFSVSILNDAFAEGPESLSLALSNVAGGVIGDPEAVVAIVDDEPSPCGPSVFDSGVDAGIFLAKNCGTDTWSLRIAEGGGAFQDHKGSLIATLPFANITPVGFGGGDTFTNSPATELVYDLGMGGNGIDGIDFDHPTGRNLCVTIDVPAGRQVLVGADQTPVSGPFDLGTLGPCTNVTAELNIDSVTVGEVSANGLASFTVSLSAPASSPVTVDYATASGTATEGSDYLGDTNTLTFLAGTTTQTIDVTIVDDALAEGDETFSVVLSNPGGADLGPNAVGTGTITDDEASPCNTATFFGSERTGTYLYKNCVSGQWSLRVAQGGGSFARYEGSITAPTAFLSTAPFSFEGAGDVLDVNPAGDALTYSLGVGGGGTDGVDFTVSDEAGVCVDATALSATVQVGDIANPTVVNGPFDLSTLGPCLSTTPDVSIDDVQLVENDIGGIMTFTVSLSQVSGSTVTVDFATAEDAPISAESGVDYLAASGSLTFLPSETSKTIDVQLVDDALGEVDETFLVQLSNVGNGVLLDDTGVGTILDDEGVTMLTINDVTIDEDDAGGLAVFTVNLSQAAPAPITVDFATVDGSAVAGEDYVARTDTLSFATGESTAQIEVTLSDDAFAEGPEAFALTLSNVTGGVITDATGDASIVDDEPSPCGPAVFDPATEPGIYLSKVCGTNNWQLRITEGGAPFIRHEGTLIATTAFSSVTPVGLAGADVLTNVPDTEIFYDFGMGGNGIDGADFEHPTGRDICVTIQAPAGRDILIGADKTPVTGPFDLGTLGACP